jgi:hypothetical protein
VPERVDLLAAHGQRVEAEIEVLRTKLEAIRHKIEYYESVLALRDGGAHGSGPQAGESGEEGQRA